MDPKDMKIVRMLMKDARLPLKKIAEELGISATAVNKRMEKLRTTGVLLGSTAIVNARKIGWERMLIALNVKKENYVEVLDRVKGLPFFVGAYSASGPYTVLVEFLGPSEIIRGMGRTVEKMKGVRDFCPLSVVEKVR